MTATIQGSVQEFSLQEFVGSAARLLEAEEHNFSVLSVRMSANVEIDFSLPEPLAIKLLDKCELYGGLAGIVKLYAEGVGSWQSLDVIPIDGVPEDVQLPPSPIQSPLKRSRAQARKSRQSHHLNYTSFEDEGSFPLSKIKSSLRQSYRESQQRFVSGSPRKDLAASYRRSRYDEYADDDLEAFGISENLKSSQAQLQNLLSPHRTKRDSKPGVLNSPLHSDLFSAALDRIGSGIIEIKQLFESEVGKTEYADAFQIKNILTNLRLPREVVREYVETLEDTNPHLALNFSQFLAEYFRVACLMREGTGNSSEVWYEGPNGFWRPMPASKVANLRAVFDAFAGRQGVEADLSSGMRPNDLVTAFQDLGHNVPPRKVQVYLAGRERALIATGGGRVPFAEFIRAYAHLCNDMNRPVPISPRNEIYNSLQDIKDQLQQINEDGDKAPPSPVLKSPVPSAWHTKRRSVGSFEGTGDHGRTISGSHKKQQAPEVDPLQYKALEVAFKKYDVNNDGQIDFMDLKTAFETEGKYVEDHEIRQWIAEHDLSGLNSVTFSDFMECNIQGIHVHPKQSKKKAGRAFPNFSQPPNKALASKKEQFKKDRSDIRPKNKLREKAMKKAFDMYDINGDGLITFAELKTVFQQQGRDASDFEIGDWIHERDTSGTGTVNFNDFKISFLS
mmetsp:Transcript_22829/g.29839  ORF Transcript_22829/g.29839 Transcript_22829/m.29839 type:complete len:674 (-) Transcript_22829:176-2197(-)